jgi:hypothetical protein
LVESLEEDLPSQWPLKTDKSSSTYFRQRDFKISLLKRDKQGHFILIKGETHQKELTIFNLYAPNLSAPNLIKHTLKDLKGHINTNTVVVGEFNTLLHHH